MGVKAAEDFITHCHRCGKQFDKADVRMPTPRKHKRTEFWYICLDCFDEEGGVWWVGRVPKYRRVYEEEISEEGVEA